MLWDDFLVLVFFSVKKIDVHSVSSVLGVLLLCILGGLSRVFPFPLGHWGIKKKRQQPVQSNPSSQKPMPCTPSSIPPQEKRAFVQVVVAEKTVSLNTRWQGESSSPSGKVGG